MKDFIGGRIELELDGEEVWITINSDFSGANTETIHIDDLFDWVIKAKLEYNKGNK